MSKVEVLKDVKLKKKLRHASFHKELFVPGLGTLGNTLPSPNKSLPGLELFLVEEGVLISTKGVHTIIPHANVVLAVLDGKYEE